MLREKIGFFAGILLTEMVVPQRVLRTSLHGFQPIGSLMVTAKLLIAELHWIIYHILPNGKQPTIELRRQESLTGLTLEREGRRAYSSRYAR